MNLVQKYYKHSLNYAKYRFILELVAVSIILKLILGLFWGIFAVTINVSPFTTEQSVSYQKENMFTLLILLGILTPFIETFTQWLPIKILKKITKNYLITISITALIFASLHLSYSIFHAVLMAPLGIVLSWSFYCKYKISFSEAFLTTFAIHSIHNLITSVFIIL